MVHKPGNAWKFLLAIALCAVASLLSCGRKETTALSERENPSSTENSNPSEPPPELPIDQQTEQKLDPLTKDDVELYLKVMRAAADRVNSSLPADKATLASAKKILAGRGSGRTPTVADVKTLERANLVGISMDQIVADEMKIDGRTYRGIAEAIESVVPNPKSPVVPGTSIVPAPAQTPTSLEKRISDVNTANQKFLAPYHDEIQKLIEVVHNPSNLPG